MNSCIMKFISVKKYLSLGFFSSLVAFAASVSFCSCTETIDESNFAIKTEQTVVDFLEANPDKFSGIKALFDRVQFGRGADASHLTSVLSARGNYTVFAPNNEALAAYVQSFGVNTIEELTDEQAELIAKSCIIDNGDLNAYEEAEFPASGAFDVANLNNRSITCMQDTINGGYIINTNAKVVKSNIEVSNGMIHEVASVIAPSSDNIYEMIAAAGNMDIFAHLLEQTTWADSLSADDYVDQAYEEEERDEVYVPTEGSLKGKKYEIPAHRYRGYTAFVETDATFSSEWGLNLERNSEGVITNWDDVMAIVKQKCEAAYGTVDADDLSSPENAINRFIAYHLIEGRISYLNLIRHYNEFGYSYGPTKSRPQTNICPTNVWDYYTTRGKYRGLVKVTQVGDEGFEQDKDHKMYLNRKSVYDNARNGKYTETGYEVRGVLVSPDNGNIDNNALNGFYYPIDQVLLYDDATRTMLSSERIRIDVTTILPELLSYGTRGGNYTMFPVGYLKNILNQSAGTVSLYMNAGDNQAGAAWRDYQGDELTMVGLYDFTFRLPPFPKNGTYELRLGLSNNDQRGMAQMYFGTNPNTLKPTGLPVDMRQSAGSISIPWVADIIGDDATNAENDKNMRNQGYMKGPQYITIANGSGKDPVRQAGGSSAAIRLIVTTSEMDADETYYLRFKSALNKTNGQLFIDYFEYVPTSVYNGATEEDIW